MQKPKLSCKTEKALCLATQSFLSKYPDGFLLKPLKRLLAALYANQQRLSMIQAKHTDKALSVYLLFLVTHQHLEGLHHGKVHKGTNLAERPNADIELMHQDPSDTVQKKIYAL